jgi:sacsin
VGIFKELIQNADDAGATTVKFLVDWRKGQTGSLFSPGMAECQGPALWAYNDAVFSDEDFENINKLAGETKVEDISKIGRFGLGFNGVYHLTDVPSFISREHLVVLDPNIHHLKRHIKDRSRPGIRINLATKPESLTRYHDQFQPYNGVFDCNAMQTSDGFYYDGTLFRFPFRTASQASSSDICKTAYGRDRIEAIVSSLCECATTLLIFSQHIKEVEVYELDGSKQPDEMQLVLSVNKPSVQPFRRQVVNNEEPFIKQCSKWWTKYRESQIQSPEFPSGCELVNIVTTKEPSELSRCDRRYSSDQMWFVVSASGTDASLKIARSPKGRARGFLPCGGAAFVIQRASEQGSWESSVASHFSGELFCFLPLSIPTGLPVHVNGYFAIMSNRVGIWKRTNIRTQPIEVEWNEALMEDALARAYIMLLENMKEMVANVQDYKFHTLWPSIGAVDMQSWEKLMQKICSVLLGQKSKLFCSDGMWMNITDGFLLCDDFNEIYDTAVEVLRSLGIHVFNLPSNILQTLIKFDRWDILQRRTLTFTEFVKQYFFPKLKTLTPTQRDAIVCFGLDRILKENESSLLGLFKQNSYISVSQNEEILKTPCELIHPFGPAAELFSEEDHRFPVGSGLRDANRVYVLEKLGMVKDLDWTGILERAQSITNRDFDAETERSRKLIGYMNKRIYQLPSPGYYSSRFQLVKFLPVLREPAGEYFFPWKGSNCFLNCLFRPNDVFLPKDAELCGSSCLIVNTSNKTGCGKLNDEVKNLLGFSSRLPEDKLVIQQLDEAIKFWSKLSEEEKQETAKRFAIESVCKKIYGFFNKRVADKEKNQCSLNELEKRNWLFLQGNFVQSKIVAYTSNGSGAPFLFTLPWNYVCDYRHLFEAMHIKQTFDDEDYISALYELESTKKDCSLTEDELQIAIFFITQINVENPTLKNYIGNIPLPDTKGILRRSQAVVVNLSLWLKDSDNNLKVHEKIPPQTAHALGAKPLKHVILKKLSHRIGYGESFGQHEELTDRLNGILKGYPPDGILKELVQNADDAEASEIHFIHDTRSLRCEKVVIEDETCKEIQGPALCVYNDRPFTDDDLKGIKKLGIGSKGDTIETTGRYGIGFNSVYHLTDCPSFLSNDETLVILDPRRRYVLDEDPGKLFKLTTKLRNDCSDTLDGYLADHFNLQGSTMFRFPLRREKNELNISKKPPPDMEKLIQTFQKEARKSLLFLNHVKKITLSKIHPNGEFEEIYQVETVIASEDEKKRQDMAQKIRKLSGTPTAKIGWERVNYTVTIKENTKEVERWLIQKCIGSIITTKKYGEIPDGCKLGLFPRGGLAARLWTHSSSSEKQQAFPGIVYCFLPLPENYTNLPVHVNGHFALDNNRRRLWTDTDGEGERSKWNHFMNTCVLPPAYADLIQEARNHLCNDEDDNQLSRYHALFPKILSDTPWETLTTELYRYLGQRRDKVLPLLVPTESENEPGTGILKQVPGSSFSISEEDPGTMNTSQPATPVHLTCTGWLSVDHAYFVSAAVEDAFYHLLIRIGVPVLLHAPYLIYTSFISAGITSHEITPESVIDFLREFKCRSTCRIDNLPKKLETTAVKCVPDLSTLIEYCCEYEDFGKKLAGLPLLLTQDGYLRVFDSHQPVFRSGFGGLFPARSHLFIHSEIFNQIPLEAAIQSEEKIVRDLTVNDLPELMRHVFTNQVLKAIEDDGTWKFPAEGILSEEWFKLFWDFLQNDAKPEPGEDSVSLECLSEWPVIPTTCGKLVMIKDAKVVLDMTVAGNESVSQENVRTFLRNLKCLMLNKEITFEDNHSSCTTSTFHTPEDETTTKKIGKTNFERKMAVTDAYVAHPHDVIDVLVVLNHMLTTDRLDLSRIHDHEEETRNLLKFVQDNYKRPLLLEEHKQIIKRLPFHKTLDGEFVSLIGRHRLCALIPPGVPIEQLDDLQEQTNCLFLNSDALQTLGKLYRDLDVRAGQDVTQFYVEYVFRHFSIFTRGQMKHLTYIRDNIHPSLAQGHSIEKDIFLKSMAQTPCIPDQGGSLHKASDFFDPKYKVFKEMYNGDNNKFPPSPFNEEEWSDLLEDIGMHFDITPQLFLQFCTMVAENARRSPSNQQCRVQSNELVKCLFAEKSLKEEKFLFQVSQIEFIAPAKLEEVLTSIHKQYQYSKNGHPPFIKSRNAVPWRFRYDTWTTAPILPVWANNMAKFRNLGIARSGPTYTNVLDHLQNVAKSYNPDSVDSNLLNKITKSIYKSLWESEKFCCHSPNDGCSDVCKKIGDRLKSVPCIFLQKDEVFVKGEQLVFNLPDKCDLKPFLYPVPREFGELEHFLKRLGATERPTPFQIAYVLISIHDQIEEEVLSTELEMKVKYAMYVLFELLYRGESADGIDELYLPSQDKQLVKSCEMVCQVSSRYTNLTEDLQRPILLRFEECKLKKAADDYINALPAHLRPVKFDELFREEVDPECKISICSEAQPGSICNFQQRYKDLLGSDEFQEGLKRLLMHDGQDPHEFEGRIKKLQTDVQTKCTGEDNIKINIINRDTNKIMDNLEESCYAIQDDHEDTWTLYMQHEFKDSKLTLVPIAICVNKILANCIHKEFGLITMLGCSTPSKISQELDRFGITHALSKTADEFIPPDDDLFSGWDTRGEESRIGSGTGVRSRRGGFGGSGGTRVNAAGSHGTSRGMGGGASFSDGGYGVGYRGGGGSGGYSR